MTLPNLTVNLTLHDFVKSVTWLKLSILFIKIFFFLIYFIYLFLITWFVNIIIWLTWFYNIDEFVDSVKTLMVWLRSLYMSHKCIVIWESWIWWFVCHDSHVLLDIITLSYKIIKIIILSFFGIMRSKL